MNYQATERNKERAEAARRGLDAYRNCKNVGGDPDTETVRDLLQDILHWLAQREFGEPEAALQDACERAISDFPNEWGEE